MIVDAGPACETWITVLDLRLAVSSLDCCDDLMLERGQNPEHVFLFERSKPQRPSFTALPASSVRVDALYIYHTASSMPCSGMTRLRCICQELKHNHSRSQHSSVPTACRQWYTRENVTFHNLTMLLFLSASNVEMVLLP